MRRDWRFLVFMVLVVLSLLIVELAEIHKELELEKIRQNQLSCGEGVTGTPLKQPKNSDNAH